VYSDGFYSAHFFTPLLTFSIHFVVIISMHSQCSVNRLDSVLNVHENRRTAVETSDQKEAMLQDSGNLYHNALGYV